MSADGFDQQDKNQQDKSQQDSGQRNADTNKSPEAQGGQPDTTREANAAQQAREETNQPFPTATESAGDHSRSLQEWVGAGIKAMEDMAHRAGDTVDRIGHGLAEVATNVGAELKGIQDNWDKMTPLEKAREIAGTVGIATNTLSGLAEMLPERAAIPQDTHVAIVRPDQRTDEEKPGGGVLQGGTTIDITVQTPSEATKEANDSADRTEVHDDAPTHRSDESGMEDAEAVQTTKEKEDEDEKAKEEHPSKTQEKLQKRLAKAQRSGQPWKNSGRRT